MPILTVTKPTKTRRMVYVVYVVEDKFFESLVERNYFLDLIILKNSDGSRDLK
jgi:hypothetical protein